jgi:hypothetical protein
VHNLTSSIARCYVSASFDCHSLDVRMLQHCQSEATVRCLDEWPWARSAFACKQQWSTAHVQQNESSGRWPASNGHCFLRTIEASLVICGQP